MKLWKLEQSLWGYKKRHKAYLEVLINDEVLIFDIAVCDSQGIKVVHSFNDLFEYDPSLFFRKMLVLRLLDTFEQVMRWTAGKFRSRVEVRGRWLGD